MMATLGARLKSLGMNYREYLASDHWKAKRQEYYQSDMPQHCIGCGKDRFELHHITYMRLGRELLGDLMPLCRECHQKVHDYANTHTTNLGSIFKIARKVFHWGKGETRKRLRRFNVNGVKEPHKHLDVLTPRQRIQVLRKMGI